MRRVDFPLVLLVMVPATAFAVFGIGYGYPDRVQDDDMPRAYVRLQTGDSAVGSVVEETYVLRVFANWLLVQDHDGRRVDWVRVDQVDRIKVSPDDRFPGLLCGIFGLWCSGRLNPNVVTPNETHAEPPQPGEPSSLRVRTDAGPDE